MAVMDQRETSSAMPLLLGLPAYLRPPRTYAASGRPFSIEDLPLEAFCTEDERRMVEQPDDRPLDSRDPSEGLPT
jgi:hypothetical protein